MDVIIQAHRPIRRNRRSVISPLGWRILVEFMTLAMFIGGCLFLYVVL